MNPIQVILVLATVALGVVVLRGGATNRHLATRRLLCCGLVLGGLVSVVWPDSLSWAAEQVGVARGADLFLYVMVMVFLFTTVSLYQRVHDLDSRITVLVRELALRAPEHVASPSPAQRAESDDPLATITGSVR